MKKTKKAKVKVYFGGNTIPNDFKVQYAYQKPKLKKKRGK